VSNSDAKPYDWREHWQPFAITALVLIPIPALVGIGLVVWERGRLEWMKLTSH
jgi:nitrate reductase NapE component